MHYYLLLISIVFIFYTEASFSSSDSETESYYSCSPRICDGNYGETPYTDLTDNLKSRFFSEVLQNEEFEDLKNIIWEAVLESNYRGVTQKVYRERLFSVWEDLRVTDSDSESGVDNKIEVFSAIAQGLSGILALGILEQDSYKESEDFEYAQRTLHEALQKTLWKHPITNILSIKWFIIKLSDLVPDTVKAITPTMSAFERLEQIKFLTALLHPPILTPLGKLSEENKGIYFKILKYARTKELELQPLIEFTSSISELSENKMSDIIKFINRYPIFNDKDPLEYLYLILQFACYGNDVVHFLKVREYLMELNVPLELEYFLIGSNLLKLPQSWQPSFRDLSESVPQLFDIFSVLDTKDIQHLEATFSILKDLNIHIETPIQSLNHTTRVICSLLSSGMESSEIKKRILEFKAKHESYDQLHQFLIIYSRIHEPERSLYLEIFNLYRCPNLQKELLNKVAAEFPKFKKYIDFIYFLEDTFVLLKPSDIPVLNRKTDLQ